MSIYSANRSGSMNLSQVCANESYNSSDMGRILYESECNDMAFFEAILASDFREIQGLQEGTLLESEVKAMNEASVRTLLASLKQRLVKFWGKIKAAFKDAMTKIAAYILRDGKAFVKNFRTVYNKYEGWTGSVKDVKRYTRKTGVDPVAKIDKVSSDIENDIRNAISNSNHEYKDKNKNEILKMKLSACLKEKDIEPSAFVTKFVEKCESTTTVTAANIDEICKAVSDGSDSIKKLKTAEAKAKDVIDKMGKSLTAAENKSDNENSAKNVSTIVTMVGVGESFITYYTKASIAVVKADIKSCRAALGSVMSDLKSTGKKLKESFIFESDDIMSAIEDEVDIDGVTGDEIDMVDDITSDEI